MNRPGERVGPFELTELIAARPLSNLWKAERADGTGRSPRTVILRIAHQAMDVRAMTELRKEYDALRAIDDPRVRKAHGFYAGFGALALEYVDGVSLRGVLDRVAAGTLPLDLATLVDLLIELTSALRAVHAAGVVHGRVGLETVRLRSNGDVVLTDFALQTERMPALPPEMMSNGPLTAATDQWLLGALLVHLITGEPLLGGKPGEPADGRKDPRPAVAAVSARSPALGRLVGRLLARDPRDRFGDDGAVLRELLATLRSLDAQPDRERLARRSAAPAAPALYPAPTPALGPPPEYRPLAMRPAPPPAATTAAPGVSPPPAVARAAMEAPRQAAVPQPLPPEGPAPMTLPPESIGPRSEPPRTPATLPPPEARRALAAAPVPVPTAVPEVVETEVTAPEVTATAPVEPRIRPTPNPVQSWTLPPSDLIGAAFDEGAPEPEPPSPLAPSTPRAFADTEAAEPPDPSRRLVPDWAAAFALVLLLAIGAWAVLSRVL